MSSEDFIRFILIMFSVLGPIRLLSNVGIQLQMGIASAERVFEILDKKPLIKELKFPKDNNLNLNLNHNIRISKMSFKYPNSTKGAENVLLI